MSGPPKTPSHLRLVRGNPSKRPINKDEPKPPKGVPQLRSISISRVSTGLSEWPRNWTQ
jgi:hypothetical protein